MSENGVHPVIGGFVPKPRTIEVVCDWLDPADGAEPLRATIAANLTFAEVAHVTGLIARINDGLTNGELWPVLAPRVLAWNAMAYDLAAGGYAPVPPPSEAGEDAFRAVDALVTVWLLYEVSRAHLGGAERGKGSTEPASSAAGSDADTSTSPPPTGKPSSARPPGSTRRSRAT